MDTDKYRSTSVPIDVTVTSDRETVASRGEYTPAGDGFVLTFSIGDGKYEITHGESDTVLSVGGLLSYTISFAAAGAVTVASLFGDMPLEVEPISRRVEKNGDTIVVSLCYALTIGGTRTERDVTVTARAI